MAEEGTVMQDQLHKEYELYSSVSTKVVDWLWYPYIPYGKLTILQGDPGCGKSTFIIDIIASVTTGKPLPNGIVIEPHNVIYQCSEDGLADTIKPRLVAAGADCNKVAYINEDIFGFSIDDEIVRDTIIKLRARLMVIDPFQAYLGDADLSNAMSMRKVLRRLSMWASQYDCAVVLVGHLNKKSSSKELYRGLGSIDVAAAARSVLQLDVDEENEDYRVLRHVKSSLASKGADICFELSKKGTVAWKENESMFNNLEENHTETETAAIVTSKQEKAANRIKELLANGPVESTNVLIQLQNMDIGKRTITDVKRILGIKSKKIDGVWYWVMPNYK